MSIVYHGDTLPLDNLKIYSHLVLLYITWGLIWDSKVKKKEFLVLRRFLLILSSEIPIKILKAVHKSVHKDSGLRQEKISNPQKKEQCCH